MPYIPKILHQTWKISQLPKWSQKWVASWHRLHPNWEYKLWTDQDNLCLIENYYPDILDIYINLRLPVQRSDLARYLILHRFGGLYADLDIEWYRPMDELLTDPRYERCEVLLGQLIDNWVDCACMAATPFHPLWLDVIQEIRVRQEHPDVNLQFLRKFSKLPILRVYETLESTGPFVLSDVLHRSNHSGVQILPQHIWLPGGISGYVPDKETFAIHHSKSSWMNPMEKLFLQRPRLLCQLLIIFLFTMLVIWLI